MGLFSDVAARKDKSQGIEQSPELEISEINSLINSNYTIASLRCVKLSKSGTICSYLA